MKKIVISRINVVSTFVLMLTVTLTNVAFAYRGSETVNGTTWYYDYIDEYDVGSGVTITFNGSFNYNSYSGSLTIPSTLRGYAVKGISDNAFRDSSGLTSITIPSSVTNIGSFAFYNCTQLKSVSIGSGVKSIGWSAFAYCSALTSITIPNNVETLEDDVFMYCSKLNSVSIGTGLKSIPSGVFSGTALVSNAANGLIVVSNCLISRKGTLPSSVTIPSNVRLIAEGLLSGTRVLTSISVNSGNSYFSASNGILYNKDKTELICCPAGKTGSITVTSGVKRIGVEAFYYGALTSVSLPSGLESIGRNAFTASSITSISIPSSVKELGSGAFSQCYGLKTVNIPNGVERIGDWAFESCTALASASIARSVKSVGQDAFNQTALWENHGSGLVMVDGCVLGYKGTSPTSITLPSSTRIVADGTFFACHDLTSVTLPEGLECIGDNGFSYCEKLSSVVFPESLTHIGQWAFHGCTKLSSVSFGKNVTHVGQKAFLDCTSLNDVRIGRVEDWCKIEFEDRTANPCYYAGRFHATNVREGSVSILIPNGVTHIGSYSFVRCGWVWVIVPKSVTSIGYGAFQLAGDLERVVVLGRDPSIVEAMFDESGFDKTMAPYGGTQFVREAEGTASDPWLVGVDNASDVKAWMIGSDTLRISGTGGFKNSSSGIWNEDTSIRHVEIGEGVTSIGVEGYTVFWGNSMTSVTLPEGLTNVVSAAFAECDKLTSIALPRSLKHLGGSCFQDCTALKTVTIHRNLAEIDEYAFVGCAAIETVYVDVGDVARIQKILQDSGLSISKMKFVEICDERLRISPGVLPKGKVGRSYEQQLVVEGGEAPYSWSVLVADKPMQDGPYVESREANSFLSDGSAMNWSGDDAYWGYDLPFGFPFYGKSYSRIYVSSNGTLSFENPFSGYSESVSTLKAHVMIAPLWDDLRMENIYISETDNAVSIRWSGNYYNGGSVNFSVTLHQSGDIRLAYGSGNANGGLIGISAGDSVNYHVASCSQDGSMSNASDVTFSVPAVGVHSGLPGGLSLSEDGLITGRPTEVASNVFTVVVIDAMGAGNCKEFAISVEDGNHECTVMFDLGAHGHRSGGGELLQNVKLGAAAVKPEIAADKGWQFVGWDSDVDCVEDNMTVKALYEAVEYRISYIGAKGACLPEYSLYTILDEVIFAPLPDKIDARFLGWSPAKIEKGSTGDVLVVANWETKTVADLMKSISNVELSGDGLWAARWTGEKWQLQSGDIENDQVSRLDAVVRGCGTLEFKWRVNSETYVQRGVEHPYDKAVFKYGDAEMEFFGNKDWTSVSVDLPDGEHVLSWMFVKDAMDEEWVGEDCVWLDDVTWTPAISVRTIADLVSIFGEDSEVVKEIGDDAQLSAFNDFLKNCAVSSVADLSAGQKQYAYKSFKLSEITTAPQLFEEEPVLKIDDVELSGGNLSLTISLTAGTEAIQLAKDKLVEKIRVGDSPDTVDNLLKDEDVISTPSEDGSSLTFTIKPPRGNQGFVKIKID